MMLNDKKVFIWELCRSIQSTITENMDRVPEEWDGIELRQYAADKFRELAVTPTMMDRKRMRNYRNEVIVRNL